MIRRMSRTCWRILVAALLLVLVPACGADPNVVVQRFLQALALSQGAKAIGLLSTANKTRLSHLAKEASLASNGAVSPDPSLMVPGGDLSVLGGLTQGQSPELTVLDLGPERAKVHAKVGAREGDLDLIREAGEWRIDLPLIERP